jgi:hypothetical protein
MIYIGSGGAGLCEIGYDWCTELVYITFSCGTTGADSCVNYEDGEISRTVTGDAPLPRIGVAVQPVPQPVMLMTLACI